MAPRTRGQSKAIAAKVASAVAASAASIARAVSPKRKSSRKGYVGGVRVGSRRVGKNAAFWRWANSPSRSKRSRMSTASRANARGLMAAYLANQRYLPKNGPLRRRMSKTGRLRKSRGFAMNSASRRVLRILRNRSRRYNKLSPASKARAYTEASRGVFRRGVIRRRSRVPTYAFFVRKNYPDAIKAYPEGSASPKTLFKLRSQFVQARYRGMSPASLARMGSAARKAPIASRSAYKARRAMSAATRARLAARRPSKNPLTSAQRAARKASAEKKRADRKSRALARALARSKKVSSKKKTKAKRAAKKVSKVRKGSKKAKASASYGSSSPAPSLSLSQLLGNQ